MANAPDWPTPDDPLPDSVEAGETYSKTLVPPGKSEAVEMEVTVEAAYRGEQGHEVVVETFGGSA